MKALKYYRLKNSTVLAASLATTLGCLVINNAAAQSSTNATGEAETIGEMQIDIETCQALNDSTALDQDSIKTRIACYSRDVQHLNRLVTQLTAERDQMIASAQSQSASVDEYKLELTKRQDAMQRLEERAAKLRQQVDEITEDRNQIREQLFNVTSEGKDRPIEVEANKRLFENFSQSYVSLTNEIEELRKRLQEFENTNTQLSDQQLATRTENQQLQSDKKDLTAQITSLEESVAGLQAEKEALESELDTANYQLNAIKTQLASNAETVQQQLSEISDLKTALADSEKQRAELESTVASLNDKHLDEITALNSQAEALNTEFEALKQQQIALQDETAKNADQQNSTIAARDDEIAQLSDARNTLNAEREDLITQITALETSHLEQTQAYKEQASKLDEQIAALTTDKTDLGLKIQEQSAENEKLKAYAAKSDNKNTELNLAADALRTKLEQADAQAVDLQTSIDELGQQSAADKEKFSEQITALNSTIEQNQQDRDNLATELDTVKPQLQTAEANLRDSEKQNEELVASVASLEEALAHAAEEQDDLNLALLETENKSKQANANLASLKDNAETLTSLLAMSRAHSENADTTLTELRAQMSAADLRLEAKQKELEALLAEKTRIEDEFKAIASKTRAKAGAIEKSLQDAGHETVKVAVSDDNNIGILLGSGQLFRTGSARLSTDGQQVLRDLASTFDPTDDRRIMISGHSDNVPLGAKLSEHFKDNWGLSMARALATANFFTDEAGISADRMTVSGFGATQPIADNETAEGRQQNRRVEISLVPSDDTIASAE